MRRGARLIALGTALFLAAALPCAAQDAPATPFAYDRVVDALVARYHLPGIAVGVIDDGKVVYRGVRGKLPSGKPMDADTLFKIASNTKAMTVTTLARLSQQGKLDWDAPVTRYLPDFRMYDPWVTRNITVGDLVAHHSGLGAGAGDLMLWPNPNHFTPPDVVHAMRYLKPSYSFRHGYAYDNTLFVVAGQVAASVGHASWAELIRREIFQPLGMTRCQVGMWKRDAIGNVAQPHARREGHNVVIDADGPVIHPRVMDAAGGVRCSLDDMLTWAMNWVAPTPAQLKWLSPAERRREWQIYTPVPISQRQLEWNHRLIYGNGHGWFIGDANGILTVAHTGVLSGMYSALTLLPGKKSAFVILINANAGPAIAVAREVLLKHFTTPGHGRTIASYADELAREHTAHRATLPPAPKGARPATPRELATHLGVWQDPWFGKVHICTRGDGVQFASAMSPLLTGKVMRAGSRYYVHWAHGDADAWLMFPATTGDTLHMRTVDPDADFSYDFQDLAFTRKHACR